MLAFCGTAPTVTWSLPGGSLVCELEDGVGVIAVAVAGGLHSLCWRGFTMGGVGALAGAAPGLGAGAGLFHLPALGQRSLVHILEEETFPLELVEGLRRQSTLAAL